MARRGELFLVNGLPEIWSGSDQAAPSNETRCTVEWMCERPSHTMNRRREASSQSTNGTASGATVSPPGASSRVRSPPGFWTSSTSTLASAA